MKVIDFTASLLNQNKKANTFRFDRLTMAHYLEVYLNSRDVRIFMLIIYLNLDL